MLPESVRSGLQWESCPLCRVFLCSNLCLVNNLENIDARLANSESPSQFSRDPTFMATFSSQNVWWTRLKAKEACEVSLRWAVTRNISRCHCFDSLETNFTFVRLVYIGQVYTFSKEPR